jgi:Zn-dependent peptidase ImmA (M78 family)
MNIPITPRYDRCLRMAHEFILQERISSLPVDPFIITKKHSWNTVTVGYLANKSGVKRDFIYDKMIGSKEAGTIYCNGYYRVIYNEHVRSFERVRWTIMHEIGHIHLNHFTDFEKTKINNDELSDREYAVLESEANVFASEILAPKALLILIRSTSVNKIQNICKLSNEASENCVKSIKLLQSCGIHQTTYDFFQNQFKNYISKVTI